MVVKNYIRLPDGSWQPENKENRDGGKRGEGEKEKLLDKLIPNNGNDDES